MRLLTITLLTAALLLPALLFSQASGVNPNYGKLPLTFEANRGQAASHVDFLSRNRGYTALFSAGNLTLSLRTAVNTSSSASAGAPQTQRSVLQLDLVGAARNPVAVGADPQAGRVNYFFGNNPAKWRTNVPTYGSIRYRNVYPGIDLIYYGNKGGLEFDFELQSGADPGKIQFEIRGANSIELGASGSLVLRIGNRSLQIQSPRLYQDVNGGRIPVQGSYVLTDSSHVAFKVAQYDTRQLLVIDPVLIYSTFLGGSGDDEVTSIAVDAAGNVYVAGYTDSTDFPLATQGSLPAGSDHVFVSKLDATGSKLLYTDYIGGNLVDYGFALAINSLNEVYVTGSTASSDFPVVNAYQPTFPGRFNGFLTRISADGSSLLYSTYFGGNGSDMPASIALDSTANIYIAGNTSSTNFPVMNSYQSTAFPNQGGFYGGYGFLSKFTADGSALAFSTYFAGSSNVPFNCGGTPCWPQPYTAITSVALDSAGNAYVGGNTNTYDFPTTAGAYLQTNSTQANSPVSFTSKFSPGGAPLYSTYFYETFGFTTINSIAVDGTGSAYVTGVAYSDGTFPITTTTICDPGVYSYACNYAFVTKFDSTGSTLVYSTFLGPNNEANPASLVLDQNDDAYVLATTSSNSFALVNWMEGPAGGNDLLLVEIDPVAGSQLNSTYLGGSTDERAVAMALDAAGNLYITGATNSTDFPVTQGAFQLQAGGNSDALILKVGSASLPAVALSPYTLQFSPVQVGTSSAPQQVLLRNMGSAPLNISGISVPVNFAETDDCGTSVPAASTCSVSITFTPPTVGLINGSIAIQDNAAGSPHVIAVSGTGSGPTVSLSSSTLTFSGTPVGVTSASQTVTLTNLGNANLTSTVQISGDYAQTNNCPTPLAPQSNCAINVTFTPTASGMRTGTLTINDNAAGSPQLISLTGAGIQPAPVVSLNPSSLIFSRTPVGSRSASQVVTLANQGNASLMISSVQITGDYAQTNNCPGTLNSQSSCTIVVTFTPTSAGNRTGTITLNDNSAGNPQSVALSGSGIDFSLTSSQPSDSIKAGVSASYALSVAAEGGAFTNAVKLVCGGAPSLATCSLSSTSVTPGINAVNVTVIVATTGPSAQVISAGWSPNRVAFTLWMPFSGIGALGLVLDGRKRIGRKCTMLMGLLVTIVALGLMSACAGGTGIAPQGKTGTPPGTYTITVTGASGNLSHSLPLNLTVQ